MILIVGGAEQAKLEYALALTKADRAQSVDGGTCEAGEIYTAKILDGLHRFIRRCLDEGRDVSGLAQEIMERNPSLTIICDELGCGIVPMDPQDRLWRETTGRLCVELAQRAERVDRVVCGLGQRLK